jgi:hypothetical protein
MPYSRSHASLSHRPLIDSIPDDTAGILDEEYSTYFVKDDDYIIHPEWKAMVQRITTRIPRRIQRAAMIYFILLAIGCYAWVNYLGPKYSRYRHEIREMEASPRRAYGTNVRPILKDTIHIKRLNERHLPTGDKRLVIVGDVHGCLEELKALLKKVKFREGRDHLILTGDIVAKGKAPSIELRFGLTDIYRA